MGASTKISWADHTASPWFVCSEVDEMCGHCYAREWTKGKFGHVIRAAYKKAGFKDWETMPLWGDKSPRVLSKGFWKEAYRLNRKAQGAKDRPRMFTSLMDPFDAMPAGVIDLDGKQMSANAARALFMGVVMDCQNLDWLLLTKRPELVLRSLMDTAAYTRWGGRTCKLEAWINDWLCGTPPRNVWLGATWSPQRTLDLIKVPAAVRWLSVEPLLGPANLGLFGTMPKDVRQNYTPAYNCIDWIVVGGESGKNRRDCGVDAILDVVRQCQEAEVPVWVKQDCHMLPGQHGRIPQEIFGLKQLPTIATQ